MFLRLGHRIADEFGVKDTSGMLNLELYIRCVHSLLASLLRGWLYWQDWFNIAVITATGKDLDSGFTPWRHVYDRVGKPEHVAAAQHGSMVVVAS